MEFALSGIVIAAVASLGGWLLVRRHPKEHATLVKAVLFGLYFWGLVFLQLVIAAVVYSML